MRKRNRENNVFTDIFSSLSKYFVAAVVIMLLAICLSGVRFIRSGNVALILRFGQLVGDTYEEQVHEPGLLLAFPYIIDEVVTVPTGSVIEQKVTTHYSEQFITNLSRKSGYVITGDQNIAVINATVKYTITDPVAYALNVSDMESVINGFVSNAMTETAASMQVDDILTSGKEAYAKSTIAKAQEKMDLAKTGIKIQNLELTKVSMPGEVLPIYEQVTTATVQANTQLEKALQYKETAIPTAQAEADSILSKANSDYASSVSDANARLAEFWGVLEEYKRNPEVVKLRIYNEKISEAISKIGKVKVVQDGESKIIIE